MKKKKKSMIWTEKKYNGKMVYVENKTLSSLF